MRLAPIAAAVLAFFAAFPTVRAECLSYTGRVQLEGLLESETFPGPPDYESVALGDLPEAQWLLRLDVPVCVAQGEAEPLLEEAETGVQRVQLSLTPEQYESHVSLIGVRVKLSGKLFHRHTGHHRTPVLLEAVRFEP